VTDTLKSLADRCEAATCGSRELDAAIARAVRHQPVGLSSVTFPHDPTTERFARYTTSLDAAMTLVEQPPEDLGEYVSLSLWDSSGVYPEHVRATAWVRGAARVYAATPALAICAAALRARASHDQGIANG
jgi:hypothetical protein